MSNRRPDMANEWGRADLPHEHEVWDDFMAGKAGNVWDCVSQDDLGAVLDTVVEHLNEHHPKRVAMEINYHWRNPDAIDEIESMRRDRDRWRRAHEIVEGERDLARDRCREAGRERDAAVRVKGEAFDRAVRAERDRDVWKDRAERADRELTDPYTQANQDSMAWNRVAAHPALRMDLLPDADHSYAGRVFERITQLVDPVEERALELWHTAHPGTAPIAATMDTLRALARHQLGQETDR